MEVAHTAPFWGQRKRDIPPTQAEALPRHSTPLPLLTHPSGSRLPYSGHILSSICCSLSSKVFPMEQGSQTAWEMKQGRQGEPQLLPPWSGTGREPHIFLPQPVISLVSIQACAAASRGSSGIFAGVKSTVAHPSPAVFASCSSCAPPGSEMDIEMSRAGSPQQKDVQGCPSYPTAI